MSEPTAKLWLPPNWTVAAGEAGEVAGVGAAAGQVQDSGLHIDRARVVEGDAGAARRGAEFGQCPVPTW